jgi:hypothetical protein
MLKHIFEFEQISSSQKSVGKLKIGIAFVGTYKITPLIEVS